MSITRDTFKGGIDVVADVIKGGVKYLHGNDAINPIARSMLSPVAVASDMWRNKEVINPLTNMYLKDAAGKDAVQIGNIAGSYLTVGAGMGVAGGLTHDSAGNLDIAGIPLI